MYLILDHDAGQEQEHGLLFSGILILNPFRHSLLKPLD